MIRRIALWCGVIFLLACAGGFAGAAWAVDIPFTVTMSEAVTVTGTPRIVLDVDGNTRYAVYTAGTGTASLTFTYTATAGDVDLNGIGIGSTTLDLNGGTVTDLAGNALSPATFTAPANMASVHINNPSLAMDFVYDADGRYVLNGTVYNDLSSFLTAAGGTFSRGSTATYFDSTGTLQTAASGVARFDHDPATLAAKGILIEESRTNQLLYSQAFDNANWTVASTVTADATTAPDGTSSADLIIVAVGGNDRKNQGGVIATGGTYTFSVYAKSYIGNAGFRLLLRNDTTATNLVNTSFNFSVMPSTSQALANGWYRTWVTATSGITSGDSLRAYIYADDANTIGEGNYFWGAQLEQGAFATSYIPTAGSTQMRQADVLTIPAGAWTSSTYGTITADAVRTSAVGQTTYWTLEGTTMVFDALVNPAGGYSRPIETAGGATMIFNAISPTVTALKVAGAYDFSSGNLIAGTTNGAAAATAAPASSLGTASIFRIGNYSGGSLFNGTFRKVKYYPLRASNTQLQLLTQ